MKADIGNILKKLKNKGVNEMVYKIKNKKREFEYSPYGEKEERKLLKKYSKNKSLPPFKEISRVETRKVLRVPETIRRESQLVNYKKGKLGVVTKVTNRGVYVNEIDKTDGFAKIKEKSDFISNKKIEQGKIYPRYTYLD